MHNVIHTNTANQKSLINWGAKLVKSSPVEARVSKSMDDLFKINLKYSKSTQLLSSKRKLTEKNMIFSIF